MAANFSNAEEHVQSEITKYDEEPLSERQKEYKIKYSERYNSLRHKFPGGMNAYERKWQYQLAMWIFLLIIAAVNLKFNFDMIDVYEDVINQLRALPDVNELDVVTITELAGNFTDLNEEGLCDSDHFANEFEKEELENSLLTVQRFLKASAYISLGFGLWFTFILKGMSAYSLCTEDFNVVRDETLEDLRRQSKQNPDQEPVVKNPAGNLIRVKGGSKRANLETEGERKIRTYLRSDTVLFGQSQILQDIPQATAAVLYLLFLLRERGVLCYESFTNEEQQRKFSIDNADNVVFGQLAIIMLNVMVNIVVNLAPRWIAYFNHQTVKHARKPKSTTVRLFTITCAVIVYLFAIFLPLFVTLYSPVGTELLGLNTTDNLFVLVLVILSGLSLAVGTGLFCCYWGAKLTEGICICGVLLTAGEMGCEGCVSLEICELCECCCC